MTEKKSERKRITKVDAMRRAEIFRELPDEAIRKLSARMRKKAYEPRTTILKEGARGDSMFIIENGQVEIRKSNRKLGKDVTIAKLKAGAIFGEMALLTGEPRSATVLAVSPTEVLILKKKDFDNMLLEHPEMSVRINKIVSDRLEAIKGSFPRS